MTSQSKNVGLVTIHTTHIIHFPNLTSLTKFSNPTHCDDIRDYSIVNIIILSISKILKKMRI